MINNKLIWSFVFLVVMSGSVFGADCTGNNVDTGTSNMDCFPLSEPECSGSYDSDYEGSGYQCIWISPGPGCTYPSGSPCNPPACFLQDTKVLVLIDEEDLLPGDEIIDVEKELNWYSLIWDKVRRFMYG